MKQCINTKNNHSVSYLHAADVRYHFNCWLVQACLPGAIVTTITTSLLQVQVQQTAQMVGYNKYECWSDASALNETCILVGISLQI